MPDKEGAHQKRLDVRAAHFAGVQKLVDDGFMTMGGALPVAPGSRR